MAREPRTLIDFLGRLFLDLRAGLPHSPPVLHRIKGPRGHPAWHPCRPHDHDCAPAPPASDRPGTRRRPAGPSTATTAPKRKVSSPPFGLACPAAPRHRLGRRPASCASRTSPRSPHRTRRHPGQSLPPSPPTCRRCRLPLPGRFQRKPENSIHTTPTLSSHRPPHLRTSLEAMPQGAGAPPVSSQRRRGAEGTFALRTLGTGRPQRPIRKDRPSFSQSSGLASA